MVRSAAQIAAQKKAAKASAMKRKFAAQRKVNSEKKLQRASSFYQTFKNDPDPKIQQQVRYAKTTANIIIESTATEKYPAKKPKTKSQLKEAKEQIARERAQYFAKQAGKKSSARRYSTGKPKNTPTSAKVVNDLLGAGRFTATKPIKKSK